MARTGRPRVLESRPPAHVPVRGTLVLIHAFPVNARFWEAQLGLANEGWHVLAPHLRGFGEAEGGTAADTRIDDYASDVEALLAERGVGSAVIGGLSTRGYTAFALYRRAPQLVRGLILADTRAEADPPGARPNRLRLIDAARVGGVSAVADEMVPKLLGATTHARRPDVVAAVRALIGESHADAPIGALHALMTRPDSTPLLGSITVPTLVIVGDEDELTPPALSEKIARGIPGAQLVTIPGAGHFPNLERPEAFNAAVVAFLSRL
mgnify:CR=1 FL=1